MAVTWERLAYLNEVADKTIAAWSKSIGSGGDYADWATMIAAMPDLIAHAVTIEIKAGTTLTERCKLENKHGSTSAAMITIQAEKYFPTSGVLPTADSATATTLRDAALATAALGNDYFNGCWIFVHHGTGTDNGPILITDYIDATGDVVVASWPGTQPDNTSRYLIVGALMDASGISSGLLIYDNSVPIAVKGIGIKSATGHGVNSGRNANIAISYCGIYNCALTGIMASSEPALAVAYSGLVGNNTSNTYGLGGIKAQRGAYFTVTNCGISDNLRQGVIVSDGQFAGVGANFGDANGTWGTYAQNSGQANCWGTECSGTSGNHSNGAGDGSLAY